MLALTLALALASVDDAPKLDLDRPIATMSRAQLRYQYAEIEKVRPGYGLPITLMAVGGGSIVLSTLYLFTTFGGPSAAFRSGIGYLFVAFIVAGVAMLFPGIWILWSNQPERVALGNRMDEIRQRLDELDRYDERMHRRRSFDDDDAPPPRELQPQGGPAPQL
jgi:hypothetical protein